MTAKGCKGSFWGNENILEFIVVTVTHICEYTKSYWIIHVKWVSCMLCELYLNNKIVNKNFAKSLYNVYTNKQVVLLSVKCTYYHMDFLHINSWPRKKKKKTHQNYHNRILPWVPWIISLLNMRLSNKSGREYNVAKAKKYF